MVSNMIVYKHESAIHRYPDISYEKDDNENAAGNTGNICASRRRYTEKRRNQEKLAKLFRNRKESISLSLKVPLSRLLDMGKRNFYSRGILCR